MNNSKTRMFDKFKPNTLYENEAINKIIKITVIKVFVLEDKVKSFSSLNDV